MGISSDCIASVLSDYGNSCGGSVPPAKSLGLSYFLPYLAFLIPKLDFLAADGTVSWPGVTESVFFTGLILAIVTVLNRWKITW